VSEGVFEGARSEAQCFQRWAKVLSVGLKKGQWTEDEDATVRDQVDLAGGALAVKWNDVADALPGRLGKQVRERWQNHLDPALSKEPWEEAEDQLLVSLQAVMGNKWSEIARAFGGRSENSVKNRWNSKQRRSLAAELKRRTGSELGIVLARDYHNRHSSSALAASGSSGSSSNSRDSLGDLGSGGGEGGGSRAWDARGGEGCIKIDFRKALQAANSPTVATAAASALPLSSRQIPSGADKRRRLPSGADPLAALCATAEAAEGLSSAEPWRQFSAFAAAAGAVVPMQLLPLPSARARASSDDEVREASAALLGIMGLE
jgi:hypothetical protein